MTRLKIIIYFILFSGFNLDAQNVNLNKQYSLEKEEIVVVINPFWGDNSKKINDTFFQNFNKGRIKVADTCKIRNNILTDITFNDLVRRITDEKTNNKKSNLYLNFSDTEIENFKLNTLNADLIIFISDLTGKKVTKLNISGSIQLSGEIMVFDLKTGEFVLQCSNKIKERYKVMTSNTPYPYEKLAEYYYNCFEQNIK